MDRRPRSSAEFVVQLGPPPISSFASTDLEAALGASGAAGVDGGGRGGGGDDSGGGGPSGGGPSGGGGGGASLLASIAEDAQMTLRFAHVCAYVSAHVKPPGPLDRLRNGIARRCADGVPPADSERQILYSVTGEVTPGEVLALM